MRAVDGPGVGEVAIFYYPWYGTEARDGQWQHWQQHGNRPPAQIASDWFPARGPYSSSDLSVVRAQMREIAAMGVQTVIVSWWGAGPRRPRGSRHGFSPARDAGLRVALHVEPFAGRAPAALEAELDAFKAAGITDFYLYDSTLTPDGEWAASTIASPGCGSSRTQACPGRPRRGLRWALHLRRLHLRRQLVPSRLRLGTATRARLRPVGRARLQRDACNGRRSDAWSGPGERYDRMWRGAVRAEADVVTITSYNEWHEGTQIEAARNVGTPYASYDGAYGLTGRPLRGRISIERACG